MKINTIKRKMHLISCYKKSLIIYMIMMTSLSALKVHNEFFINNQINLNMYNIIY